MDSHLTLTRPSFWTTFQFIIFYYTWCFLFYHFSIYFFHCPYTLLMRCGRVFGIKLIWWYWISVSRDYTTLPYLTIWHVQTIGVSNLCCLEFNSSFSHLHDALFSTILQLIIFHYTCCFVFYHFSIHHLFISLFFRCNTITRMQI